jgi:hypothetical protein
MFAFALSITIGLLLSMGRFVEIMICQAWFSESHLQEEEGESGNKDKEENSDGQAQGISHSHDHEHNGIPLSRSAFITSANEVFSGGICAIFTATATIYAGLEYFDSSGTDNGQNNSTYPEEGHRALAGSTSTPGGHEDDVPVWLLLAGFGSLIVSGSVFALYVKWRDIDHEKYVSRYLFSD